MTSAGSLGSHADEVEKSLRDTLEIAKTWSAVLLIDEVRVSNALMALNVLILPDRLTCASNTLPISVLDTHAGLPGGARRSRDAAQCDGSSSSPTAEQLLTTLLQVAVFLRLLEYHEGVLFLTTNRVKVRLTLAVGACA